MLSLPHPPVHNRVDRLKREGPVAKNNLSTNPSKHWWSPSSVTFLGPTSPVSKAEHNKFSATVSSSLTFHAVYVRSRRKQPFGELQIPFVVSKHILSDPCLLSFPDGTMVHDRQTHSDHHGQLRSRHPDPPTPLHSDLVCVGRPYTWEEGVAGKVLAGEYRVLVAVFKPSPKRSNNLTRKNSLLGMAAAHQIRDLGEALPSPPHTRSSSDEKDADDDDLDGGPLQVVVGDLPLFAPSGAAAGRSPGGGRDLRDFLDQHRNLNTLTNHIEFAAHENQGPRRLMEDRHVTSAHLRMLDTGRYELESGGGNCQDAVQQESLEQDLYLLQVEEAIHPTCSLFAVFDGHNGVEVAGFVADHIAVRFQQRVMRQASNVSLSSDFVYDIERALRETVTSIENELLDISSELGWESGCTAVVCVLYNNSFITANLGDSRAVLSNKGSAVDLTQDQNLKEHNHVERQLVVSLGGSVDNQGYLNGMLAVSRAFGNYDTATKEKMLGLSVEPVFNTRPIAESDEFLILACDGLWDVFTSSAAVDFVRWSLKNYGDVDLACKDLVDEALSRGSHDNITVMLVSFHKRPGFKWVEPEMTFATKRPGRPRFTNSALSKLKTALKT